MPRLGHMVSVVVGLTLALATPRAAFAKAVMLSCPAPGAEPGAPNETWILDFTPTDVDESLPEHQPGALEIPNGGDCSDIEIVPGLACLEDQFTEWAAGIKGLCDAPYGLGIRKGDARWVLVARIKQGPRNSPLVAGNEQLGCRGPGPSHAANVAPKTVREFTTPNTPTQPVRHDVSVPSFDHRVRAELPGIVRRVDRPPRHMFS